MAEKTPKRLEMIALYVTIIVGLQAIGIFDIIREILKRWILGE